MPKRCGAFQARSGAWITKQRRLAIYLRDDFTCLACGSDLRNAKPADVTLDHLVCQSNTAEGGKKDHSATNLVTMCRSCNSSRGNKPYTEFFPGGALFRVEVQRYLPLNVELAKALIAGTTGDKDLEG